MAEPLLAEIRVFGFNFNPIGWLPCNGQLLNISQNTALFSLLGTTYGGNGTSTFALPDFRGRVPLHPSGSFFLGQSGGTETVTLEPGNLPSHTHSLNAYTGAATTQNPNNSYLAAPPRNGPALYTTTETPIVAMAANSLAPAGTNSQVPFSTHQPGLVLNFCIATQGVFPSRN